VLPEGAHHHAAGRRLQEPERHDPQGAGLFANVRPTKSYAPFVASPHPGMDLVIIRENEEDLYAGIEHQQTNEVAQVLKLITRPGTERIVRYAFEYARAYGRRQGHVHDEGQHHEAHRRALPPGVRRGRPEYPDIESDHQIIDIGAARLAAQPERFDVIVTLNLYGDILSDIAAQVAGSVGSPARRTSATSRHVRGGARLGAGHRGARRRQPVRAAERATQMLVHLGEADVAERIKNAWLCALESGIHTADIYRRASATARSAPRPSPTPSSSGSARSRHSQPVQYRVGRISVQASPHAPQREGARRRRRLPGLVRGDRDPDRARPRLEEAAREAGS
jgi:isocitrate dehydrogenase